MKLANTLPCRSNISKFLPNITPEIALTLCFMVCLNIFLSGCSKQSEAQSIEVETWYKGSPLTCNAFEENQDVWTINQFAFFMSEVSFAGKEQTQVAELANTPWQTDGVVLIQPNLTDCALQLKADVEEVSTSLQNDEIANQNLKMNRQLSFSQPMDIDSIEQLTFTLGVPFELNHQNPLLQPSPLNLPNMFWSWRSGHKFLRLDTQAENNNWVFHLGSVGCEAASIMRSPQGECIQPNRMEFRLEKKHEGSKIVVHLDRLITKLSLQNNNSCLFHGDQQSCSVLMSNLATRNVFEWH